MDLAVAGRFTQMLLREMPPSSSRASSMEYSLRSFIRPSLLSSIERDRRASEPVGSVVAAQAHSETHFKLLVRRGGGSHRNGIPPGKYALAMINEGLVALAFDCREHLIQLARLADRYADQKPDLADLCLVRMSELFPKHFVITPDRTDFQVYRRNKREAIPILCPPER
jgi:hypothetical protein